jgi:hypothetical protein
MIDGIRRAYVDTLGLACPMYECGLRTEFVRGRTGVTGNGDLGPRVEGLSG